jgi:hypothetical protein
MARVNLAGIAAHPAGGAVLLAGNKGPPGHAARRRQRHRRQGGGDRAGLGGHGLLAGVPVAAPSFWPWPTRS